MDEVFNIVHDAAAVAERACDGYGDAFGCDADDFGRCFGTSESVVERYCFADKFFYFLLRKHNSTLVVKSILSGNLAFAQIISTLTEGPAHLRFLQAKKILVTQRCNYVVTVMTKYATISVPAEVKSLLEKAKGDKEWGDFILDLYKETRLLRSKKAFMDLTEIVTEEDLKAMAQSSREFREKFAFT